MTTYDLSDDQLDEYYEMLHEIEKGHCGDDGWECGHCARCCPENEEQFMEERWIRGE